MASEAPVVVLDACVLYPFHLRNLLVQTAVDALIRAHWPDAINNEWIRNLAAKRAGLSEGLLKRTRDVMNAILPEADVANYEEHMNDLDLPDPNDRHVLAVSIACRASTIVTGNLRDFPDHAIAHHGIIAQTPDALLCAMARDRGADLLTSVMRARLNLRRSRPSPQEFVDALRRQHLPNFAPLLEPDLDRL